MLLLDSSLLQVNDYKPCAHLQIGGTALHRAALSGREDLVQLLLSHGAHASAKNFVSKLRCWEGMPRLLTLSSPFSE